MTREIEVRAVAKMRRRMKFLARSIALRAQLIVGAALGRILQRLVRFVRRLEFFLGAVFLAHVRMILARKLAIGGFDFRLAGFGLHAQSVVVVFELHPSSPACIAPDYMHYGCNMPLHPRAKPAASIADRGLGCQMDRVQCVTLIRRGVVSGFFGIEISSTPCLPLALMPSASALSGSAKRR